MACKHMIGITLCNDGEKLLLHGHDKWWKERKPEPRDIVFSFCPYCGTELRPTREERGQIGLASDALCEGCPPSDYPTDKTRCLPCPRRAHDVCGTCDGTGEATLSNVGIGGGSFKAPCPDCGPAEPQE